MELPDEKIRGIFRALGIYYYPASLENLYQFKLSLAVYKNAHFPTSANTAHFNLKIFLGALVIFVLMVSFLDYSQKEKFPPALRYN